MLMIRQSQASFSRSIKKVLLIEDVPNLGFKGEWAFVKPGYAFNQLVPQKQALFASDPEVHRIKIDLSGLKQKQEMRVLEVFLNKLKDIRIIFDKEVSEINKNVAKEPVKSEEVLDSLNKRYNLGIKKEDFKMDHGLDTIGEHFVQATFTSEQFKKEFSFYVKVVIRQKKIKEKKAATDKKSASEGSK